MTTEYLHFFPPPFLADIVRGRCLPFIGAGFSLNAKLPDGKSMKDWEGVGHLVADQLQGFSYSTAVEAISTYDYEHSRAKLVELLSMALHVGEAQPGPAHEAFCRIPFERVVTTNWDFLMEDGYALTGRRCTPMILEEQLAVAHADARVTLLKLHGDIHHPTRMVATEEDYDGFLARFPLLATYLSSMLIDNTALFIGYSLEDADFRQVWQVIKDRLGSLRRPAYSLQVDAPGHLIARYERRGVKVINLPRLGRDYSEILAILFRELREHWTATLPLVSTSADPEPQVDLALPKDAQSRLAYFAVPINEAAEYKTHIYPLVERVGLTPIMALDVATPGDNIMAKVQALIKKSALVIVDVDSRNAPAELALLLTDNSFSGRFIAISKSVEKLSAHLADGLVLVRPTDLDSDEAAPFLARLGQYLAEEFARIAPRLDEEPLRLLQLDEYRAAVIASYSLLEHELRLTLAAYDIVTRTGRRPVTIRELLSHSVQLELLSPELVVELQRYSGIRVRIAHTYDAGVDASAATTIVQTVFKAIDCLRIKRNRDDASDSDTLSA